MSMKEKEIGTIYENVEETNITCRQILFVLRRDFLKVIAIVLLGFGLVTGSALVRPKTYASEGILYFSSVDQQGNALTEDQKKTNIDLIYNVKHYMMKDSISKELMELTGYDKQTLRNNLIIVPKTNSGDAMNSYVIVRGKAFTPEMAYQLTQKAMDAYITNISKETYVDVQIAEQPTVNPVPFTPIMHIFYLVGAAAGIALSLLYVIIRINTDPRLYFVQDAEAYLGLPVINIEDQSLRTQVKHSFTNQENRKICVIHAPDLEMTDLVEKMTDMDVSAVSTDAVDAMVEQGRNADLLVLAISREKSNKKKLKKTIQTVDRLIPTPMIGVYMK